MNIFLNQKIELNTVVEHRGVTVNTTDLLKWLRKAPLREKQFATEASLLKAVEKAPGLGMEGVDLSAYANGYRAKCRDNLMHSYFISAGGSNVIRIYNDLTDAMLISPATKLDVNGKSTEESISAELLALYVEAISKAEPERNIVDITESGTFNSSDYFVNSIGETLNLGKVVEQLKISAFVGDTVDSISASVTETSDMAIEKSRELTQKGLQWILIGTEDCSGCILNIVTDSESRSYMTLHCNNADQTVRITHRTYVTEVERLAMLTFAVVNLGMVTLNRRGNPNEKTVSEHSSLASQLRPHASVDLTIPGVYSYDSNVTMCDKTYTVREVVENLLRIAFDGGDTNALTISQTADQALLVANQNRPRRGVRAEDTSQYLRDNRFAWILLNHVGRDYTTLNIVDVVKREHLMTIKLDESAVAMTHHNGVGQGARESLLVYTTESLNDLFYNREEELIDQQIAERAEGHNPNPIFADKTCVLKLLADLTDIVKLANEDFTKHDLDTIDRAVDKVADELDDIRSRRNSLLAFEKRRSDRGAGVSATGLSGYLRENTPSNWTDRVRTNEEEERRDRRDERGRVGGRAVDVRNSRDRGGRSGR